MSSPLTDVRTPQEFDRLAEDFLLAFNEKDEAALQRLNQRYGRSFTFDDLWAEVWRRVYAFRQRAFREPNQRLRLEEAQIVVAQDAGFSSWHALQQGVASGAKPIPPYEIDERDTTDLATEYISNLRIRYYYAGLTKITDRSLETLGLMSTLEQIELCECNGVSDAGLPFLATLPRLRDVHLDSLPGVTLEGSRVFPPHVRVKYST